MANEVEKDLTKETAEMGFGNKSEDRKQHRYAILVIDMQNDFVKGKLKCERAGRIIPNIKILLDTARQKQIPVFLLH